MFGQEEQNRGKPNWEHLSEELHVLISVEDTENRAKLKLKRAIDEVKRLLVPVSFIFSLYNRISMIFFFIPPSPENDVTDNNDWFLFFSKKIFLGWRRRWTEETTTHGTRNHQRNVQGLQRKGLGGSRYIYILIYFYVPTYICRRDFWHWRDFWGG